MSDIQVIIFPDQFTITAIRADASLVNISKKITKAGFFEKRKLKKLAQKFLELKTALILNPEHSLVISADLAEKVVKYASDGEVLNVSAFTTQDSNDGLFDLDGGVSPHED